eukprot:Tamp_24696.p1 GENE.Tamp_24696~~Tamp_24696.p1  ORF type:complete len:313 (+),score=49.12 Tamp_24696:52-939(+)
MPATSVSEQSTCSDEGMFSSGSARNSYDAISTPTSILPGRAMPATSASGPLQGKKMSRGGGRPVNDRPGKKRREMLVVKKGGIAQYTLTKNNQIKTAAAKKFLDGIPARRKDSLGTEVHPHLGVKTFTVSKDERILMAGAVFNHTKKPIVEFRKWMCDFGWRAATSEDTTTYTFDLQGYNDTAYRLTSGGRNAGGRPNLKFKPEATDDADKECPDAGDAVAGKKRKRFSQAEDDSTETEFGTPPLPPPLSQEQHEQGEENEHDLFAANGYDLDLFAGVGLCTQQELDRLWELEFG